MKYIFQLSFAFSYMKYPQAQCKCRNAQLVRNFFMTSRKRQQTFLLHALLVLKVENILATPGLVLISIQFQNSLLGVAIVSTNLLILLKLKHQTAVAVHWRMLAQNAQKSTFLHHKREALYLHLYKTILTEFHNNVFVFKIPLILYVVMSEKYHLQQHTSLLSSPCPRSKIKILYNPNH